MRPEFRSLYFGKSDSLNEARSSVDEFIRSYVDLDGAVAQVASGNKTLILGPKGTGKSALGLFIEKTGSTSTPRHYARMRSAASLPLSEIPQLKTGQPAGADRTYGAWKFILLCNYLDVALGDPDSKIGSIRSIKRVVKTLRDAGFIGSDSGRTLLKVSATSYTIDKSAAGDLFRDEGGAKVNIFTLTPYLERWAMGIQSPNRHILLLDGLDSIFLNDARYDESIAGLAQAAYDLNQKLFDHGATGSIVLLMRNDIFSRISLILPDAHKMRDFAYDLDWRVLSGAAGRNAPLFQLVNRKAAQEQGTDTVDVLSYFPPKIGVGKASDSQLRYLLNLTRHTPRDMLQLMEYIRLAEVANPSPQALRLSESVIREGVLQYSAKYFVDAVKGELAGYEGGRAEAEAALKALKLMPESQFTRSDFRRALASSGGGLEAKADDFLRLFFFAGALGNVFRNGSERYLVFYHRRDDVDLNVQGTLVLHNALTHAWSRKFGIR